MLIARIFLPISEFLLTFSKKMQGLSAVYIQLILETSTNI